MKFTNLILSLILCLGLSLQAKETKKKLYVTQDSTDYVDIDFKDLKIIDLVKFVSKIINKNILISDNITGKVDFISTVPVHKDDILDILIDVLASKGLTLVGEGDTLRVIRAGEASKAMLPILYDKSFGGTSKKYNTQLMVTEFIDIEHENVDVVSAKIRHLSSKHGKIVTNANTNTIIITDHPRTIKVLKQAIKIISRDKKKAIKIITAKNIRLSTLVSHITKVNNAYYTNTIIPSRITIIENSEINSIILIGNKGHLDYLAEYIEMIEEKAVNPRPNSEVAVIYLKNTESKSILSTLKVLLSKQSKAKKQNKTVISSDDQSNSLVIIGSQEDITLLKKMIKTLDKEKQQVYVSVKVIEISKKVSDSLGAKYGVSGGALTSNGLLTFALNLGGSVAASNVLGSALSDQVKQGAAIGAGIDFLVQNSVAKVVSEPSIICVNNKESKISVGERRSILTSSSVSSTTTNNSYKREDIGLSLKVKPRISNDKKVTLEVDVKLEDVVSGTGGESGTPTTTKREISTTAVVNHGESVVVGGLVRRKKTKAITGINFFSDIPFIGPLFGGHTDVYDNVNLVIIMTPYIIETSSSLSKLREELAELEVIKQTYLKAMKSRLENFKKEAELSDLNYE